MFMRDIDAPTNDNSYSGAGLQLPGTSSRSRRSARRAIAMISIWGQSSRPQNMHGLMAHSQIAPFSSPGGGQC
jgi:hypothetical protein